MARVKPLLFIYYQNIPSLKLWPLVSTVTEDSSRRGIPYGDTSSDSYPLGGRITDLATFG